MIHLLVIYRITVNSTVFFFSSSFFLFQFLATSHKLRHTLSYSILAVLPRIGPIESNPLSWLLPQNYFDSLLDKQCWGRGRGGLGLMHKVHPHSSSVDTPHICQ